MIPPISNRIRPKNFCTDIYQYAPNYYPCSGGISLRICLNTASNDFDKADNKPARQLDIISLYSDGHIVLKPNRTTAPTTPSRREAFCSHTHLTPDISVEVMPDLLWVGKPCLQIHQFGYSTLNCAVMTTDDAGRLQLCHNAPPKHFQPYTG